MTITTTAQVPAQFLIAGDIINMLPAPMRVVRIELTSLEVCVWVRSLTGGQEIPFWYGLGEYVQLTDTIAL